MDDKVNTSQNTEYAGPPKSHNFQENATGSVNQEPEKPAAPKPAQKDPADTDLLAMISAADRKPAAQTKQKKKIKVSFNMKEFYAYRRKVHEYLKKQTRVWKKVNLVWMILKSLFYILGIGFFATCLFLYFHFESVVRTYLQKHNLENVSVESVEYSRNNDILSVSFNNVREKNGLFRVSKISVSFSFAGLLDKKIQMVSLDGLKMFENSKKTLSEDFQSLSRVLWSLGILDNRSWFTVQSLRLDNSTLYLRAGKEYISVNLSGVGNLSDKKLLTLPISFDSEYASISADVQLDIAPSDVSWTIDVLFGSIDLPAMDKQDLTGKFTAKTYRGDIKSFNFLGTLKKDGFEKDVDLQLTQSQKGLYALKSLVKVKDKNDTTVEFNAYNLAFDQNLTSFSADSPVFMKVSNLRVGDFAAESVSLSATGVLKCNFDGCTYTLNKEAELSLASPTYRWLETRFSVPFPLRLPVAVKKAPLFSFDDKAVNVDLPISKVDLSARKSRMTRDPSTTTVFLNKLSLNAVYDIKEETIKGSADADIESLVDDTIGMTKGTLKTNFTGSTHNTFIQAEKMTFNETPYFKLPMAVNASFDSDYYFGADINSLDGWLLLNVNGYYYPYTSEVVMGVKTNKPLVFTERSPSPFEISELFSKDIKNVRGKVDLKGEIHYSNLRSIAGPMKVLLDNVSFDFTDVHVKGLTSVLNLTHIVPLGAPGLQEIYASSVNAALPFENVFAEIGFEASRKQFNLSSLDATVAGYHLRADPMWYGYDSPSYMFLLKGKPVPVQGVLDNMNLKDLKISGTGSVTVTAQMRDNQFVLRNLDMTIPSEGSIQYTPKTYASPYLENLKSLEFKRLNSYLTQQTNDFEFVFSADNKVSKVKKKTSFRLNIKEPLEAFVRTDKRKNIVPDSILKAKEAF